MNGYTVYKIIELSAKDYLGYMIEHPEQNIVAAHEHRKHAKGVTLEEAQQLVAELEAEKVFGWYEPDDTVKLTVDN